MRNVLHVTPETAGTQVAKATDMPFSFAQGTRTTTRIATPANSVALPEVPGEAELQAMSTAAKIERLLIPQHAGLRTAVAVLRSAARQLADTHAAPILRRVVAVVDDLALSMNGHLDRKARVLYPSVMSGPAPAHVLGALQDHHDGVATRLRWLQLLLADVRAAAGLTQDTMVLFAGIATVARLLRRHRELEQWVVLGASAGTRGAATLLPRPAATASAR